MSNTRAPEWRFPPRPERPEAEPPTPDNVSSQERLPEDHKSSDDDWDV